MEIKILGPGCAKCKATVDIISRAADEAGKDVTIEKITDMRQIASHGVMAMPAVVIDGRVVHKGSVPSREQVLAWLA